MTKTEAHALLDYARDGHNVPWPVIVTALNVTGDLPLPRMAEPEPEQQPADSYLNRGVRVMREQA